MQMFSVILVLSYVHTNISLYDKDDKEDKTRTGSETISSIRELEVSSSKTKTYGDRAFSYIAPTP